MALYFEIQDGIINNIYDVENPQPDIGHNGLNNEGVTWLLHSGDFKAGDLYDGTSLSYGPETLAEAKEWRNNELQATDFIVPLTDYPNHAAWLTYRQELRDWTTTDDFPETKPTKP